MSAEVSTLREIASKIFQLGKLAVPGVALLEFLRLFLTGFFTWLKDWLVGMFQGFLDKVDAVMGDLEVDLAPPQVVIEWIAKINVIVPLEELVHYLILYLAIASVLVGIKWARNLIPGFS